MAIDSHKTLSWMTRTLFLCLISVFSVPFGGTILGFTLLQMTDLHSHLNDSVICCQYIQERPSIILTCSAYSVFSTSLVPTRASRTSTVVLLSCRASSSSLCIFSARGLVHMYPTACCFNDVASDRSAALVLIGAGVPGMLGVLLTTP